MLTNNVESSKDQMSDHSLKRTKQMTTVKDTVQ